MPARSAWYWVPRLFAALVVCAAAGAAGYAVLLAANTEKLHQASAQRLEFYVGSLVGVLEKHEHLPYLLGLERDLLAALDAPGDRRRIEAANRYLEVVQRQARIAAAYLMDAEGLTLAASNSSTPQSFVGQRYTFRPYFREALAGRGGRYYAVGVTTQEPGYFISAPVRRGERILGVAAVKVSLDAFEAALAKSGERMLVVDADGIAFLASVPAWKYRTLGVLPAAIRTRLQGVRQYGDHPLEPLVPGQTLATGGGRVRLAAEGGAVREFLVEARGVGHLGWSVVLLADLAEARRAAAGGGLAVGFALAFAAALGLVWEQRRHRREELRRVHAGLEKRIAERTADLTDRVAALKRTEAILRETRDDAVQAGKLAVLGQMAAGISHELNQPLAALHTLSDNAGALIERGRLDEARENLSLIGQTIARTGRILAQLKTFARRAPAEKGPVGLREAIDHALLIVEPRRREIDAAIAVRVPEPFIVQAEAVRLEQVLVNLIRNGLDAMAGQAAPLLDIAANAEDGRVRVAIRDRGPGIAADTLPHLFEPFYTTKPVGEGLGLGLAISQAIVEGFGGRIEARNADGGGAEFAVLLDAACLP